MLHIEKEDLDQTVQLPWSYLFDCLLCSFRRKDPGILDFRRKDTLSGETTVKIIFAFLL